MPRFTPTIFTGPFPSGGESAAAGSINTYDLWERALTGADASFGAWLFAIMFRRFGPPCAGSDGYKDLACWYLTTPLEGVALRVTPYLGARDAHSAGLSFGYWISPHRRRQIKRFEEAEVTAWCKKFARHAMTTPRVAYACLMLWKKSPDWQIGFACGLEFSPAQKRCALRLINDLNLRIGPPPHYGWRFADSYPRHPSHRFSEALMVTVRDLLRPTNVRDVYSTPLGQFDDYPSRRKRAPYFKLAGWGTQRLELPEFSREWRLKKEPDSQE